jgi:hypothetical protein
LKLKLVSTEHYSPWKCNGVTIIRHISITPRHLAIRNHLAEEITLPICMKTPASMEGYSSYPNRTRNVKFIGNYHM